MASVTVTVSVSCMFLIWHAPISNITSYSDAAFEEPFWNNSFL